MIAKTNPESVLGSLNLRVAGSFFISPFLLGLGHQAKMVLIILSRSSFDQILQMKHNLWQPTKCVNEIAAQSPLLFLTLNSSYTQYPIIRNGD